MLAVSADGNEIALGEEHADRMAGGVRVISLGGKTVRRWVIHRKNDCDLKCRTRDGQQCPVARAAFRRAAEANAFLRQRRFRSLPPLKMDERTSNPKDPFVAREGDLVVELDVRRGVLEVRLRDRGVYRRNLPTIAADKSDECGDHEPQLAGAWLFRRRLLLLVDYVGQDFCGSNPPPLWIGPIVVAR
jgi:hypothetical protein